MSSEYFVNTLLPSFSEVYLGRPGLLQAGAVQVDLSWLQKSGQLLTSVYRACLDTNGCLKYVVVVGGQQAPASQRRG